jgi:hypothetical protein
MYKDLHDKFFFAFANVFNHFSNVTHVVNVLELGRSR